MLKVEEKGFVECAEGVLGTDQSATLTTFEWANEKSTTSWDDEDIAMLAYYAM